MTDECSYERFRNSLPGHDCQTARYAGLAGLNSGELLAAAEQGKFDLFLTVDPGYRIPAKSNGPQDCDYHFPREVEPSQRPVALVPECLARIASIQPGQIVSIEA
jgi:hypothetical protein